MSNYYIVLAHVETVKPYANKFCEVEAICYTFDEAKEICRIKNNNETGGWVFEILERESHLE